MSANGSIKMIARSIALEHGSYVARWNRILGKADRFGNRRAEYTATCNDASGQQVGSIHVVNGCVTYTGKGEY